jgi:hypothetical protein
MVETGPLDRERPPTLLILYLIVSLRVGTGLG